MLDTYKLQSGQTSMQNGILEIKAEVDIKCWLNIWAWQYCYVYNWNKTVGTYQINWQGRNDDKTRWRENIEETHKHTQQLKWKDFHTKTNETKFIRLKVFLSKNCFQINAIFLSQKWKCDKKLSFENVSNYHSSCCWQIL